MFTKQALFAVRPTARAVNNIQRRTLIDRSFRLANVGELAVADKFQDRLVGKYYSWFSSSDLRPRDVSKQVVIDLSHEQGYQRGHIKGAVNLSVERFDFTRKVDVYGGITQDEVYQVMKSIGVSNDTSEIILYDNSGLLACRLWFVLRYFGFKNVRVLNGGWRGWLKNGLPVDEEKVTPIPAKSLDMGRKRTRYLTKPSQMVFDVENKTSKYLDLRRSAAFDVSHIPGAVNIPVSDLVEDALFKPVAEARKVVESNGFEVERDRIIAYSARGLSSSVGLFVLEMIGGSEHISLYDAGYDNWEQMKDDSSKLSADAEDRLRH